MRNEISVAISNAAYRAYEKRLLKEVQDGELPKHIAVIMDGNRRFAQELGMEVTEGHELGRDKLEEVLDWCLEVGIKILTVYAFSTENLKRKPEEIEKLMELFAENFRKIGDDERVHKHGIRVRTIGQRELLPQEVQESIAYAEEKTKEYENYFYNVAVAYGSREEIIDAVKRVAADVKGGKVQEAEIDAKLLSKYLYTADFPDPDLVLRTSGEERVSNFLLWQLAYSELYFTDVYWPGFRNVDFLRAIR